MHLLHMFYICTGITIIQLYGSILIHRFYEISQQLFFVRPRVRTCAVQLAGHLYGAHGKAHRICTSKKTLIWNYFQPKQQHPQGFFLSKKRFKQKFTMFCPLQNVCHHVISLRPRCHGADPSEVETCEAGGPYGWWLMFGGRDSVRCLMWDDTTTK